MDGAHDYFSPRNSEGDNREDATGVEAVGVESVGVEDGNCEEGYDHYGSGDDLSFGDNDEAMVNVIQSHDIVEEWRYRLIAMSEDLLKKYDNNEDQFAAAMGITTKEQQASWDEAHCLTILPASSFDNFLTTELSVDIHEYVTSRLCYVIHCLNHITGKHSGYVKKTYIDPFKSDLIDRWQWESLLNKWREQLHYMKGDLETFFTSPQRMFDAMNIEEDEFERIISLEDKEMQDMCHEEIYVDWCLDVDVIVPGIKRCIEELDPYLENLENSNAKSRDVVAKYRRCFNAALRHDSEWDRLIGVNIPCTAVAEVAQAD
jgi:hypothetical protein